MNLNNMDNSINLLICLFIVMYHSTNMLNLPNNIVNILQNPIILIVLLISLSFLIENKTTVLLLIISYFVVILKSKTIEDTDRNNEINEDGHEEEKHTVTVEEDNYKIVKNINQNKNIISNVSQTQLDTIQGKNYNHCK